MKCEKGFKEENGKCVKERKTYCDTNILTAFVNRNEMVDRFGWRTANRFNDILRKRNIEASRIAKKIGKCVVDRNTLLSDIGNHNPSMAGILTSINLSDISIEDIGGEEEGINAYNKTCAKVNRESNFYGKFCKDGKIKSNKELGQNNLKDVRHFGSAIKNKSEVFLTGNKKDFKPLEHDTNIKIE